jgi:hypothetical protein
MEQTKERRDRPKKMRIKVISAGKQTYWYADKIGKEFDVYVGVVDAGRNLHGTEYIDSFDYVSGSELWHEFSPDDCEIVSKKK